MRPVVSLLCLGLALSIHGAEQDFWSGEAVGYKQPIRDLPINDVTLFNPPAADLDKIQVVSSAIRVLPRNPPPRGKRQAPWTKPRRHSHSIKHSKKHHHSISEESHSRHRRQVVQSYRRPRNFNFVTNKADRLPPPPIVRVYPLGVRDERAYDTSYRKGQRRIIYYANLPEIVRPPMQWFSPRRDYFYDPRQYYPSPSSTVYSPTTYSSSSPIYSPSTNSFASSSFPSSSTSYSSSSHLPSSPTSFSSSSSSSYPSTSENEITRVQSNIIDVSSSSQYDNRYSSSPKFTIIDVEPPYNSASYNNRPPVRFEPYPSPQYTSNRFFNDVRTPPYRDQSHYPNQSFQPEVSLEPIKLQVPTAESSTSTTTESSTNSTRFLPDILPANLRSLAKFVT